MYDKRKNIIQIVYASDQATLRSWSK